MSSLRLVSPGSFATAWSQMFKQLSNRKPPHHPNDPWELRGLVTILVFFQETSMLVSELASTSASRRSPDLIIPLFKGCPGVEATEKKNLW